MQRKGASKDWVQEVLKQQRRDAWNLNQYISRKAKTLPVLERLGSVTDLFLLMARGSKSWRAASVLQRFLPHCSKWITVLQHHHSAGCDLMKKKHFAARWWSKYVQDINLKKISFANALLELYLSGRERRCMHSTSYQPWLSGRVGMLYLLSAEQACLHCLQAALTPLRAMFESRSPELLFQICRSAPWNQPQTLILGVH